MAKSGTDTRLASTTSRTRVRMRSRASKKSSRAHTTASSRIVTPNVESSRSDKDAHYSAPPAGSVSTQPISISSSSSTSCAVDGRLAAHTDMTPSARRELKLQLRQAAVRLTSKSTDNSVASGATKSSRRNRRKKDKHTVHTRNAPRAQSLGAVSNAMQSQLRLFDTVAQTKSFTDDPFASVMDHLNSTMSMLQPQTADVGRAPAFSAESTQSTNGFQ